MRRFLQIFLPVIVLAAAGAAVWWLRANMPKPVVQQPPPNVPLVRTVKAQPATVRLDVHSQGTVEARTAITLAAQVSGRVVAVAPSLRSGGFFAAGETLFRIEAADYELTVAQREADVARASLRLAQERAESQAAIRAWQQLEGDRPADPLTARLLHVAEAEKALAAAEAALAQARLDLARTSVSLPFAGRVRRASVDVGMIVTAGAAVGEVYATDSAEVRLPIPDREAQFLDLPLDNVVPGTAPGNGAGGPAVELVADFGGRRHRWHGVIDRVEGEIDRRTRQLTVVARVADPYATAGGRPPLAVGMFVQATITGRAFDDVVALPRQALRSDGSVLVLDEERRLRRREVQVLRQDRSNVYVRGGIMGGEQVCVSALEAFVDGMPVRVATTAPAPAAASSPEVVR